MGSVNSSTKPASGGHKRGDVARLWLFAAACGAAALAVLPFEPWILGVCNVGPGAFALPLWAWLDDVGPLVLQTAAIITGASILFFGGASPSRRRAALVLLLGFVVTLVVTRGLKSTVGRLRPQADPARAGRLWSPIDLRDDRSFPSGHVSVATAIAAALWVAAGRGRARHALFLVPPLMMLDRVCLAVHWPSDVLGGAAIGAATTAGVVMLAGCPPADRFTARFGRGGPVILRAALLVGCALAIARVWRELPLGRDPVSGAAVPGFSTEPAVLRVALEPVFGPPLHLAGEDIRAMLLPALGWALLVLGLVARLSRRRALRLLAAGAVFAVAWGAVFRLGGAPPDRFRVEGRDGVFADWHLHGDDPVDGAATEIELRERQKARGVAWSVTTHHSRVAGAREHQGGVVGTEWSGAPVERATFKPPWPTAHVLLLGEPGAVAPAMGNDVFAAIADARAERATVIVAHSWRTDRTVPGAPTFDEYAAAGVHGFEVGNRRRETDPAALARLRDLDRRCREHGMLRFSFSDDHGWPAGSPCVSFIEGVSAKDVEAGRGPAILAELRRSGAARVIPLVFHPGDPTRFAPVWLHPIVVVCEYFRSLQTLQFATWFVAGALVLAWILGSGKAPS
jgi:membrane-associated phospholipid phosphatase